MDSSIVHQVRAYYDQKLDQHADSPQGVDWNSAESQRLRFRELLRLTQGMEDFEINDYGCGYGALIDVLSDRSVTYRYHGYDISEKMIATARARYAQRTECDFTTDEQRLPLADFTIASGIFNVKQESTDEEWLAYLLDQLSRMARVSRRGFAFNVLSAYSDVERRRPHLYYADPCFLFDHCKRTYSRQVALLHDYGLYEFTMLVRKS